MTAELERVARPGDPSGVLDLVRGRRARHARDHRTRSALLAVVVIASTVAGFSFLTRLFDPDLRGTVAITPFGAEGAIVVCGDAQSGQLCRIDGDALARGATSQDLNPITSFGSGLVFEPAVSTDGSTVVFGRQGPSSLITTLWTTGTDGAGAKLLDADHHLRNASWSPDGRIVAVADDGTPDGGGEAALAILDPAAVDPIVDTIELPGLAFPSAPRFSPDGTQILFVAGNDPSSTGSDVYTVDIDGSNLTNQTRTPRSEWAAAWSPDGRRIAFGFDGGSGPEIYVCANGCSSPRRLENASGDPIYGGLPVWAPDGGWIAYEVVGEGDSAIHAARVDGSQIRVIASPASGFAWIPVSKEKSPSLSPSPVPEDSDIGLGFNVCNLAVLGGIDFLGDGTDGTAWTATKVEPNGKCPSTYDGTNGVAVDFTGDGEADSWSETIEHCTMCGPFMARDLNEDGAQEVIITLQGGSIMQYGIYTVMPVDRRLQVVPFRTGEPGHGDAGHAVGEPFAFWVGGDEGSSYWFHCEALPEFRLGDTYTPVDGGPDAETTVHETHVSLGTDGVAHILDAQTYTVVGTVDLQYATSKPDCGLGVDIWRLQAP